MPAAIILVRGELCAALLHHCTSGVTGVVSLSLRVFVALVKGFKVSEACLEGIRMTAVMPLSFVALVLIRVSE